ncbi:MAG: hypothetical protein HFF78_01920 [Oscillospiraceae bacterium]|nr:hypothetical protein [Oscillospiraceae bacterium]
MRAGVRLREAAIPSCLPRFAACEWYIIIFFIKIISQFAQKADSIMVTYGESGVLIQKVVAKFSSIRYNIEK